MNRKQRRAESKQSSASPAAPSPYVQAILADAARYHQAGRYADAERFYRQALQADPRCADALHLLGVLAHQVGRPDVAVDLIGQAIALDNKNPSFHSNLGNVLMAAGRLDEAAAAYGRALSRAPQFPDAHNNLGIILRERGKFRAACDSFRAALKSRPDYPEAHNNLGTALHALGSPGPSIDAYRRALILAPAYAEAYGNLATALGLAGDPDAAIAAYRRALVLKTDYAEGHSNLGNTLSAVGDLAAAAESFRRALVLRPDYAEAHYNFGCALKGPVPTEEVVRAFRHAVALGEDRAEVHNNLGSALKELGRPEEAVASYDRALILNVGHAGAYYNRGNALSAQGRLDAAVQAYGRAVALQPGYIEAGSNRVFTELYRSGVTLAAVLERAHAWNATHAAGFVPAWPRHARPGGAVGRPRLGFISGDFRKHAVGFLAIPAIEGLARAGYSLSCYSTSARTDELTPRFVAASAHWRQVADWTDDAIAAQIQADGVDILIDLSGYSEGNRLLALARRPAPLQVAWLGYPATAGVAAMDYILADRAQLPPEAEPYYTEAALRLPDSYVLFEPPAEAPPVDMLPASTKGFVTFGSFNVIVKITPDVVAVWSRILAKLPNSRLLLKAQAFDGPGVRRRYTALFAAQGIAAERLQFVGTTTPAQHMAWMRQADIALDPFPYAGGRTTLEALWMGLPIVTMPGETFASRHTLGYLTTLGLEDGVASDRDDYVDRVTALADDLPRLAAMRAGLRERILGSPLCDADRFVGHLSTALETIWRRWRDGAPPAPFDVKASPGSG